MSRRIAVITGSRADACPFKNVIRLLGDSCLHIQTTGLYGHEAFIKETLEREWPDFVVLLGDRYETLVAAGVAALLTIPIVHLHGGEITEGAVDDSFRHAISKLAYYHFVCHAKYKARLERLGESPDRIFVTGAPSVDALADFPVTEIADTVVCYHPETLGMDEQNVKDIAACVIGQVVVASPNADRGSDEVNELWNELGYTPKNYSHAEWLSLMRNAKILIGNSSSFIFEGMTLGKRVIMVGDRQKGRYEDAMDFFKEQKYPYGYPGSVSPRIVELLMTLPIPNKPRKEFHE